MTPLVTLNTASGQDLPIRSDVLAGIREASLSTGVDFSYLMAQANRESSFDPGAEAKTSSASGLYQFVEQTWLGVVKNHGAEYGQGDLANKIVRRSDGYYAVSDAATRQDILELRRDPAFASAMAAEHAADNQAKLEEKLGRDVNGTDLYMAHFLGISGALKFLRNLEASPDKTGASLFPKAAAANKNVFYTEGGRPRTVAEIYDRFSASMNADMEAYASLETPHSGTTLMADLGTSLPARPNAAYLSSYRNVASGTGPESNGFGKVGSLLSPLMLVTLAALPVGREESGDDRKSVELDAGQGLTRPSTDGSLFNRADDPLHLATLRSTYTF